MKLSKIAKIISLNIIFITSFSALSAPTTYESTWATTMEGQIDGLSNDDWNTYLLDNQQTKDIAKAQATADNGLSNANQALLNANNAQTDATTAISTANQAQTMSTNAFNTATTADQHASQAQNDAGTAVSTANAATTTAVQAKTMSTNAFNTATTADQHASQAQNDASTAFSTANAATTTAVQAKTMSTNALTTSTTADQHASQAQNDASTAVSTANAAKTTAVQAQKMSTNALTTSTTADQHASQAQNTANTAENDAKNAYSLGIYAKTQALQAEQHAIDNENSIRNVQGRVDQQSKTLANHEDRITKLENQENRNFSNLKNQIDNNRRRSSTGIAGVSAMANIPQVLDSQKFSVGVGVGTFDSENAIAVGTSFRVSEHVVAKTSISSGSYGGTTFGLGVSFGF